MSLTTEDLQELEVKIGRLKIEYEQYFLGALKRDPQYLRGEVQRMIQQALNRPPANVRHKFNDLESA